MDGPALDLELGELRSLAVLAEQRHFGRAAKLLGVSQPALTKRLQRLEDKVGGALLVRGYRALTLTEAGRVFVERARALLRDADQAVEVSRQTMRGEAGRLRIGFGIASIAHTLPEVLLRFRRTHPRVQVDMRDMSSPGQLQALERDEIDLGFVRMPITGASLVWAPILHERLVAATGLRSAWVERAGLRSLAQVPFVIHARAVSASYYDHVIAVCRAAGFTPRVATETNDLFSVLQLVRAGAGVGLVPSAVAGMRVPGVRLHPVRLAEAAWDIAVAWRKGPPEPLVDAFVGVARAVYAERRSG
jgi:DNA-binding transcriptional LysR family regulator